MMDAWSCQVEKFTTSAAYKTDRLDVFPVMGETKQSYFWDVSSRLCYFNKINCKLYVCVSFIRGILEKVLCLCVAHRYLPARLVGLWICRISYHKPPYAEVMTILDPVDSHINNMRILLIRSIIMSLNTIPHQHFQITEHKAHAQPGGL